MQTVVFFNTKGGTGKSTTCLALADLLHACGYRVVIVDSDIAQHSCTNIAPPINQNSAFPVLAYPELCPVDPATGQRDLTSYAAQIARRGQGQDFVLVDLPAKDAPEALAAIVAADVVIIPSKPGQTDIDALENETYLELHKALAERKRLDATRPLPPVWVVPVAVNTQLNVHKYQVKQTVQVVDGLQKRLEQGSVEFNLPPLADALIDVVEQGIAVSAAAEEMTALKASVGKVMTGKASREKLAQQLKYLAEYVGILPRGRAQRRRKAKTTEVLA